MKEEHWPYTLIWIVSIAVIIVFVIVQSGCRSVPVKSDEYIPPVMRSRVLNPNIEKYIIWKIEQDRLKRADGQRVK